MTIYSKCSYSKILTYKICPQKIRYLYITGLIKPNKTAYGQAGLIGTALYKGIELNLDDVLKWYLSNFIYLTDTLKTDCEKIKIMIFKLKDLLKNKNG